MRWAGDGAVLSGRARVAQVAGSPVASRVTEGLDAENRHVPFCGGSQVGAQPIPISSFGRRRWFGWRHNL